MVILNIGFNKLFFFKEIYISLYLKYPDLILVLCYETLLSFKSFN